MVATVTFQGTSTVIVHDESIECKQHFGHLQGYKNNSIALDYTNYDLLVLLIQYLLKTISTGNMNYFRYTQIEDGATKLDKIALQAEQLGRVKYPEDPAITVTCINQLSTLDGTLEAYQTFKKQGLIAEKSAWSQSSISVNLSTLLKIRSLEIIQIILHDSAQSPDKAEKIRTFVNNPDGPLAHNRNQFWQKNPTATQIAVTDVFDKLLQKGKVRESSALVDPISAQLQALRNK